MAGSSMKVKGLRAWQVATAFVCIVLLYPLSLAFIARIPPVPGHFSLDANGTSRHLVASPEVVEFNSFIVYDPHAPRKTPITFTSHGWIEVVYGPLIHLGEIDTAGNKNLVAHWILGQ